MAQLEDWEAALAVLDGDAAEMDLRAAICFLAGKKTDGCTQIHFRRIAIQHRECRLPIFKLRHRNGSQAMSACDAGCVAIEKFRSEERRVGKEGRTERHS